MVEHCGENKNRSVAIFCSELHEAYELSIHLALNGYENHLNKAPDGIAKVFIYTDDEMIDGPLNGIDYLIHASFPNDLRTFANRFVPFEPLIAKCIQSQMNNILDSNDQLTSIMLSNLNDEPELKFMSDCINMYFKNDTLPLLYRYYMKVFFFIYLSLSISRLFF